MKFRIRETLRIMALLIGVLIFVQCSNNRNEKTNIGKHEVVVQNSLDSQYYYLVKDENGIPNKEGLVLLHSDKDSIFIDPKRVVYLHLYPIWERPVFPIECLNFPNLRSLWIGMRSFEELPEEISQLSKLESLDLQNSNLKRLPQNIGDLKELQDLTLLFSEVEELPLSICNLKKLKRLHIGGTKIKKLPDCLNELDQLEDLIFFYESEEFSNELKEQIEILKSALPNCTFHLV